MNHFEYRRNLLHAEDIPVSRIAKEVGTPVYVYAEATLRRHYEVFSRAFEKHYQAGRASICYAMKANSNQAVIATFARLGAGADVVSEGELRRALAAGIPGERIVFSGVGKTRREMAAALDAGIAQFNVESLPELEQLNEVALSMGRRARISLRVNPDVDARTHAKIATGKKENKFGIAWSHSLDAYRKAAAMEGVEPVSVDLHIGSQLTDLEPFRLAFTKVGGLIETLRDEGIDIRHIDLGGGLGIPYAGEEPPHPDDYAAMIQETLGHLGCDITLEPGRLLVGNAGILLTTVIYVKEGEDKDFVIVDAAMNDLIRPTLYEAHHEVVPLWRADDDVSRRPVDIVGPVCETGDYLAVNRPMPKLAAGDILAVCSAGAYGAVLSSTYNSRPLVPEVMVRGGHYAVIRPRQPVEDLIAMDVMPPWLKSG